MVVRLINPGLRFCDVFYLGLTSLCFIPIRLLKMRGPDLAIVTGYRKGPKHKKSRLAKPLIFQHLLNYYVAFNLTPSPRRNLS